MNSAKCNTINPSRIKKILKEINKNLIKKDENIHREFCNIPERIGINCMVFGMVSWRQAQV
jgi:hypothetical protein